MNMHHIITKSLFVGAAIVGTGISSSHAGIKIPESLQKYIRNIVEKRIEDCYRQVRDAVPKASSSDLWEKKDDVNTVCDLILNEDGFSDFCSLEMMYEPFTRPKLEKDLRYFFKEQCPEYNQMVQFSNEQVYRSALYLNRRIRSVIGAGDKYGDVYDSYYDKEALAQRGIVEKDGGYYYYKHSFVFSDEFIRSIADAIFNGMKIINKMCEIKQSFTEGHQYGDKAIKNECSRMRLREVGELYMKYLLLKDLGDMAETPQLEKFIERAEIFCQDNVRTLFHQHLDPAHFLSGPDEEKHTEEIFQKARKEVEEWKKDIEDMRNDREYADPSYWAPAPVSDEEGADILKELEENDTKKDTPNAFLEEID